MNAEFHDWRMSDEHQSSSLGSAKTFQIRAGKSAKSSIGESAGTDASTPIHLTSSFGATVGNRASVEQRVIHEPIKVRSCSG